MADARPPSGEQIEIRHDDHVAVVVSVGAGIRSYDVGGAAVFDGYPVDAMCDGARGQTLIPWPNRVRDGTWSWGGSERQLALTEPEQHNAIHGLVRWLAWSVAECGADRVTFACTSYPQPGYPWPLDVEVSYRVDGGGLTVTQSVRNRGTSPAPIAAGAHPYLTAGTPLIDECDLVVPARTWLPTGEQQIPVGREPVDATPYDFREPRRLGATEIDYTFTDLQRDADGRCTVRLSAPDGRAASLWVGAGYDYIEIFTGDALPDPQRRRRGLGVEPMTSPPNALATGESLVVLAPDDQWSGEWGITPRCPDPAPVRSPA